MKTNWKTWCERFTCPDSVTVSTTDKTPMLRLITYYLFLLVRNSIMFKAVLTCYTQTLHA